MTPLIFAIAVSSGAVFAASSGLVDRIEMSADDDVISARYYTIGGIPTDRVKVDGKGNVLRVVIADSALRGGKRWPSLSDRLVAASYAASKRSDVHHRIRLRKRVDPATVRVTREGTVVLVRIPRPGTTLESVAVVAKPATTEGTASVIPAASVEATGSAQETDAAEKARDALMHELLGRPTATVETKKENQEVRLGEALEKSAPDGAATTDGASEAPVTFRTADALPAMTPLLFVAGVALLGLVLLPWVQKKKGALRRASGAEIEVLERKSVTAKTSVALLNARGRLLLIGTSEAGLSTLADLGPADTGFEEALFATETGAEVTEKSDADAVVLGGAEVVRPDVWKQEEPATPAAAAFQRKVAAMRGVQ